MSYELVAASATDVSFYGYLFALKKDPQKKRGHVVRWFNDLTPDQKSEMMRYVGKSVFGTHERYVKSIPMEKDRAKTVLGTWIASLSFESLWDAGKLALSAGTSILSHVPSVAMGNKKPSMSVVNEKAASVTEKTLRMTDDVKTALLSEGSTVLYDDDFWDATCAIVGEEKFKKDRTMINKVSREERTKRCAQKKSDPNFLIKNFNYGGYLRDLLRSYREDFVGIKQSYDYLELFAGEVVEKIDELDEYSSVEEWLRTFSYTLPEEWKLPNGRRSRVSSTE